MRMLFVLFLSLSVAHAGYIDANGYRYMLADPTVDISVVDFSGDDCPSLPCPAFAIPAGCNISSPADAASIALLRPWSTSFLATGLGVYPVVDWMQAPEGVGSLVSVVAGSVSLTDYGFQARILLRCLMPCPEGSVLNGIVCSMCPIGQWASGGVCVVCSNKPYGSIYISNGIGSSNCSFACALGTFSRAIPSPSLLVGDQNAVRLVANSVVSTLYRPLVSDATYAFRFMTMITSQTVYLGSYSVNLLNITSGIFSNVAGMVVSPFRGSADGVGTSAAFNSIVSAFVYQSTHLMVLDGGNCNLRRVDLSSRAVSTAVGSVCGYLDGVGLSARLLYPVDMVFDAVSGVAYVAENLRIRGITMSSLAVTTIAGNGQGGSVDGVGISAVIDPKFLALSPDGAFLFVKTVVSIRQIDLSTLRVTTLASFSFGGPYQLVSAGSGVLYFASGFEISAFAVASRQVIPLAGGSASGTTDGIGSAARFSLPVLMSVVENSASRLVCMSCPVCTAGSYSVCNASTSGCEACPLGKFSLAGSTQCFNCMAGTFGSSSGVCVVCGTGSFSAPGSTACTNCSAGTIAVANQCVSCVRGMFSVEGSTVCSACTNLIGNSTFAGNGTNATNCAVACLRGFTYSVENNFCSSCSVGEFSAAGSTVCSQCVAAPSNASYTGVGLNATSCPFACSIGYTSNGAACIPCPSGTRMVAGVCVPCLAGSFSGPAASVCSSCASGSYSLQGASVCALCANQGPFTQFVGRGTSVNCPFFCRAGAFVFNRTSCVACTNGTFSAMGSTTCSNCASGTWSGAGASACAACTSMTIVAAVGGGVGLPEYAFISKAGWAVQSVMCL